MRRTLVLALLAGTAGALALKRAVAGPDEQVELHFDDGSLVAFDAASEEAGRLLPLARDVLSAARAG